MTLVAGPPANEVDASRRSAMGATESMNLSYGDMALVVALPGPTTDASEQRGDNGALQVRHLTVGPYNGRHACVHATTHANVLVGVDKRITKKQIKPTMTPQDKREIATFIAAVTNDKYGLYRPSRVEDWVCTYLGDPSLDGICSKKWTKERVTEAVRRSHADCTEAVRMGMKHKVAVKAEAMPDGKAPRLICADGDVGQLYALMDCACLEWLTFCEDRNEHGNRHGHHEHSIKHQPKEEAIDALIEMMAPQAKRKIHVKGTDGSAWDTCCNQEIRDLTENVLIDHISMCLMGMGVVPDQWTEVHKITNKRPKLKLLLKHKCVRDGLRDVKVVIDAIRRSGHRGTSILNWIANTSLTLLTRFSAGQAAAFYNSPHRRIGLNLHGEQEWFTWCAEGDDMVFATSHDDTPQECANIEAQWTRYGFNMKQEVHKSGKHVTFCGTQICLDVKKGGMGKIWIPELVRNLTNMGCVFSSTAMDALERGNRKLAYQLCAPGAVARSYSFRRHLPFLTEKLMELATFWNPTGTDLIFDHDTMMKHELVGNVAISDFTTSIRASLGSTMPYNINTLNCLGMPTTAEELTRFMEHTWATHDSEALNIASFIPASWC